MHNRASIVALYARRLSLPPAIAQHPTHLSCCFADQPVLRCMDLRRHGCRRTLRVRSPVPGPPGVARRRISRMLKDWRQACPQVYVKNCLSFDLVFCEGPLAINASVVLDVARAPPFPQPQVFPCPTSCLQLRVSETHPYPQGDACCAFCLPGRPRSEYVCLRSRCFQPLPSMTSRSSRRHATLSCLHKTGTQTKLMQPVTLSPSQKESWMGHRSQAWCGVLLQEAGGLEGIHIIAHRKSVGSRLPKTAQRYTSLRLQYYLHF